MIPQTTDYEVMIVSKKQLYNKLQYLKDKTVCFLLHIMRAICIWHKNIFSETAILF